MYKKEGVRPFFGANSYIIPFFFLRIRFFVEIAGFEPASKQGTNMLSTRLSWPKFSSNSKTQATNYCLIC